ncbi:MAG TPA: hypothetical protein VK425_05985, partial [Acidimicrobiales bacterium]|nr:hypothetical protein [Acidimicrobiales bacterium]
MRGSYAKPRSWRRCGVLALGFFGVIGSGLGTAAGAARSAALGNHVNVGTNSFTGMTGLSPARAQRRGGPCGWRSTVPSQVLIIWEENHGYSSIIHNPAAPEINALATECGLATAYQSLTHPSLPNYLEMTSALPYSSSPWTSDCDAVGNCQTEATSVFSELAG